jgi:phosphate-selective porin OprO and OprP
VTNCTHSDEFFTRTKKIKSFVKTSRNHQKNIQTQWIVAIMVMLASLTTTTSALADSKNEPTPVGNYIYWDDGISLTGPASHANLHVGGKFNYDLGNINADEELQLAFPGFEGSHDDFRHLSVSLLGHAWNTLEFKLEVDFANVRDVKDNWVRFTKGSILPHFTFGHMKEPFSLDMLTGSTYLSFMEFSLPTRAFSPFRNFGVTANGTWIEERMTWATGLFYNTGSYSDAGEGKDQISDANGSDLSGRLTGLPIYRDNGRELVHLGLSYLHRFRDDSAYDPTSRHRTRPESYFTDDRLVDTALFYDQGQELISLEAAWQNGSVSLQGEYFHNLVNSYSSLQFNGWYAQGSWFVTGESRKYHTGGGIFTGIVPENEFRFGTTGWGAVELALRLSEVDLNDKFIVGGKEGNLSVGVNWYLRKKIRVMTNYVHVTVEDRAEPFIKNGSADIVMSRLQVNF